MNADTLRTLASDFFHTHASALGLDRNSLTVDYVLNWGGFVNYSFRAGAGQNVYHLKLGTSAETREGLRRWRSLGPMLEPYHAPPILDWIDLGPAAGLLFPSVPGEHPALHADVVAELVPTLVRLNADRELAAALPMPSAITAREVYLDSFYRRFTEDLRGIHDERPPFLSDDTLQWLDEEVEELTAAIQASLAFAEPLVSPVHGDLWLDNVLWVNRDSWFLVDWDDLRIGDPAADLAALLGPTAQDPRPLKMYDQVARQLSQTQRERLTHLGRATLLDWIIDPVSDWIDASAAPAHVNEVRAEKERVHRLALQMYRELYR